MKPRLFIPLVAIVAGTAGFFAGAWWKGGQAAVGEKGAVSRATAAPALALVKAEAGKQVPPAAKAALESFSGYTVRVENLTAEQFGQRYAELMAGADSTASLLERAAMLGTMTPERAAAAYLAYKQRTGASLKQNTQEIRHLLTVAGERDGAATIAAMQKAAPGFTEMSSLVHGWALKEPAAAVEWYNNLADGDPQRKTALDGLMWGLSLRDAATVGKVFRDLSLQDQLTSGRSLGRSLFTAQGGEEVNRLIEGMPPEVVQQCLVGACERAGRRAPAETVPWLASHLGVADAVDESFLSNWHRWSTADPAAAEEWRAAAVQANPRIAPMLKRPDAYDP